MAKCIWCKSELEENDAIFDYDGCGYIHEECIEDFLWDKYSDDFSEMEFCEIEEEYL